MANYIVARIKGTIALTGGRAFFVPAGHTRGIIMAKEIMEITNRVVSVTRRGFLGKAGKVLAISAATVVPLQLVKAEPSKRAEMAKALHEAASQFDDDNCPTHVQVCNDGQSLNLVMDAIRESSVEEIEVQLLPLFGGAA